MQADAVRPARTMVRETPASPPSSSPGGRGERRVRIDLSSNTERSIESSRVTDAVASSAGPRALDLRAQHVAAFVRVEGVAPVHGAAVVPHHQVADLPHLVPGQMRLGCMRPEAIEQRLAL